MASVNFGPKTLVALVAAGRFMAPFPRTPRHRSNGSVEDDLALDDSAVFLPSKSPELDQGVGSSLLIMVDLWL